MSTTPDPSNASPDVPAASASPHEPALVDRRAGNRRRRLVVAGGAGLVVVAVVAGVVVATTGGPDPAAAADDDATPTTLTVGLTLEPTNLDIRTTSGVALDQVLIDNVYEGLLSRSADGTVGPGLATAWTVSDDALTYTFTLADGATFSNGHALTAEDVVWSLDDLVASEGVDSDLLTPVEDVTASDDTTVVLTLGAPDPDLEWALSGRAGLVLDSEATNDLQTTAVGSGPYLLDGWKQGDSLTLVANPEYWGTEPAAVGTVVFRYLTDTNAAINALDAGDLDVLAPIDALLADQVTREDVELVEGDATDKFVLAFNNAAAPLNDLRVRQAIRSAIDHPALVEARGGVDALLGGPIAPGDPGYEDLTDLYPHDVVKATDLLAQAGYADGLDLTLTIPSFYGTTLADLLTSQLAQAGIRLTVESVEFSTWLEDVYTNKDYQLSIVDHAESHDFAAWANPDYYFAYDNAQVQDLVAQASVATSAETADELLAQAARLVSQDAAADWLTNFRTLTAVSTSVHGFPTDFINARLDVTGVTVDQA
ncbi:MAG: ABC transporter substrate-binding protein [Cellulomonadaceae bacterium]|nr:ABC transporter substrate-binding protein [Cellulomonadaceae bacterium]